MNFSNIKEEGEDQIYIEEYFREKYNLQLRYPFLPCIESQGGYFPVEVCYLEKVRQRKFSAIHNLHLDLWLYLT